MRWPREGDRAYAIAYPFGVSVLITCLVILLLEDLVLSAWERWVDFRAGRCVHGHRV